MTVGWRAPSVDADGASIEVAARSIVNACGVWADDVRALDEGVHPGSIRPAKGVHITLPWHLVRNDIAVIIPVRGDKRSLFLVPWGPLGDGTFRHVYVGTTDTDYHGSLDEPQSPTATTSTTSSRALNHSLDPSSRATDHPRRHHRDVGRPAAAGQSQPPDQSGAHEDLSRRHQIAVSATGVVTVTGGKLTTYREMAADAVDALRDAAPPQFDATTAPPAASACSARLVHRARRDREGTDARAVPIWPGATGRTPTRCGRWWRSTPRSASRWWPGCPTCGPRPCTPPATRWPPPSTTCWPAPHSRPSARPFRHPRRGGRRRGAVAGRTRLVRRRDRTPGRPLRGDVRCRGDRR